MKLKLGQLIVSREALENLAHEKIRGSSAMFMARNFKEINKEFATYGEKHKELLEEFGTPVPGRPGEFKFIPGSGQGEKFTTELNAYLDAEITLNIDQIFEKDITNIQISTTDIIMLEWLIASESVDATAVAPKPDSPGLPM